MGYRCPKKDDKTSGEAEGRDMSRRAATVTQRKPATGARRPVVLLVSLLLAFACLVQAGAGVALAEDRTVYVANSTTSVYHFSSSCSNMKHPTAITLSEAQSRQLRPCKKCAFGSNVDSHSGEHFNVTSTDEQNAPVGTGLSVSGAGASPVYTRWDADLYPDYVRVVDEPVAIDVDVAAGTIRFSSLDALGRAGRAVGRIDRGLVEQSAGWRSGFSDDVDARLAGWGHNGRCTIAFADGTVYNGYFWNRSHLVADSLGGYDHATGLTGVENLVCGTRAQNVGSNRGSGGMAYFETRVLRYLEAHPEATVWYSVTPLYDGDELVPRSVYVEALSSDGVLDVQGEVYNCAAGYAIDYHTGTFSAA